MPTVNYALPQLFPLKRLEVPSRHVGGRRFSQRQNFRRSQARLVNSVIDGHHLYSGRGPQTAASVPPRGKLACELRKQAEPRIAAVVIGQQPPPTRPPQQQPSESCCAAGNCMDMSRPLGRILHLPLCRQHQHARQ